MADERIYGMADQANRDPPSGEGLRGEKASLDPAAIDAEFSHKVKLETGRQVVVSDDNGVAFAETTGRAGIVAEGAKSETALPPPSEAWTEPSDRDSPARIGAAFVVIGVAAGLLLGTLIARLSSSASRT